MVGREVAVPLVDENGDEILGEEEVVEEAEDEVEDLNSANRYRTQRRGGKGVIDIKTTKRNGRVVGIVPVDDTDELMMMTVRGKIQRVAAKDISVIGRNTQGVRIMSLDEGDTLTAIVRVPPDEIDEAAIANAIIPPTGIPPTSIAPPEATSEESSSGETRSDEPDSEVDSEVDSDNED